MVEQRADLERIGPIRDERIGEDLVEVTASLDLTHDVMHEQLFLA